MKALKMVSMVVYHCFKLLQIGVYALASVVRTWQELVDVGFVVFALLVPTVVIYVASFRCSGKPLLAWKAAHGYSVMLGYLSYAISVMMCFDLNWVGYGYVFIFGLCTIPVMVEGLVAYVLWKRHATSEIEQITTSG